MLMKLNPSGLPFATLLPFWYLGTETNMSNLVLKSFTEYPSQIIVMITKSILLTLLGTLSLTQNCPQTIHTCGHHIVLFLDLIQFNAKLNCIIHSDNSTEKTWRFQEPEILSLCHLEFPWFVEPESTGRRM